MIIRNLLIRAGIELNPGPPRSKISKLSFAYWNLDGLLARDGIKMSLVESIVESYSLDIFAIGESSLCDKVPNEKLMLSGFSSLPVCSDCKNIDKKAKGGVLLYFKNL